MTKDYSANYYFNKSSTISIRRAEFDQRKSDYVRNTHDRTAVFIEQAIKNIRLSKNTQNIS